MPRAVTAIDAVVDAIVRDIERREQHQTAAIDLLLDVTRGFVDFLDQFGIVGVEQHRHFGKRQAMGVGGFLDDRFDRVARDGTLAFFQRGINGGLIDETGNLRHDRNSLHILIGSLSEPLL